MYNGIISSDFSLWLIIITRMKTSNISLYYPRPLDKVLFIQGTCLRQTMLQHAYWFVRMAASLEPWRGRRSKEEVMGPRFI